MNRKNVFLLIFLLIALALIFDFRIFFISKKQESFNVGDKLMATSVVNLKNEQKIEVSRYFIVKELSLFESKKDLSEDLGEKMFTKSYIDIGINKLHKNLEGDRYKKLRFDFNDEKISSSSEQEFEYSGSVILYGYNTTEKKKSKMQIDYYLTIKNESGTLKIQKLTKNIIY